MSKIEPTKTKIKQTVKEFFLSSSFHALPNIFKTKRKPIKFIWITFFLVSSTFCIFFIFKSVFEYLDFKVTTLVEVIDEQEVEFPAISLCCRDEFNFTSLDDVITYCIFSEDFTCLTNKTNYFETFRDGSYGKCIRINSGNNIILKSHSDGIRYGLLILLNNSEIKNYLIINIHNRSLTPSSLYNREINLAIGSAVAFAIRRVFNQNLPQPYSNCIKEIQNDNKLKNNKYVNFILNKNITYTQKECIRLCRNDYYIKNNKCGCNVSLESFEELCYLKPNLTKKFCIMEFRKIVSQNNTIYKICLNQCPLECDSIDYLIDKHTMSTNNNYTQISVYYESLKYTLISQQPKLQLDGLVSNIGGILGLFIGISFLSLFEIIEILIETFYILIEK